MGRRHRVDRPGEWKHVVNRGTAKRTVFETEVDMLMFQSLLAAAVKAGLIEVHAFVLLTTHFHLLVRSLVGRLAESMHGMLNGYARWFNRTRKRDGPLWRNRYSATAVETWEHWAATLWYIDRNPVDAGIVRASVDYPYGSAFHYGRSVSGPEWLTRHVVEGYVRDLGGSRHYSPSEYLALLPQGACVPLRQLIERRFVSAGRDPGPLTDLVRAAPLRVQQWMVQRSQLADGTKPGAILVNGDTLDGAIRECPELSDWQSIAGIGGSATLIELLSAGLYRVASGLTLEQIGDRQGVSARTARERVDAHAQMVAQAESYAALAASLLAAAVAQDYGPVRRLFDVERSLPIV